MGQECRAVHLISSLSFLRSEYMPYNWLLVCNTAGWYNHMGVVRACHLPKVGDRLTGSSEERVVGWHVTSQK